MIIMVINSIYNDSHYVYIYTCIHNTHYVRHIIHDE